jgi:hypothetical protein
MSTAIQPPPGSTLGDLATKALRRISGDLNLGGQQIESIREAWFEYMYALETLNFDVAMSRINIDSLNQTPSTLNESASGGTLNAHPLAATATITTINAQQKNAQDFISLTDSVATLSQSSRRMSIAYTRLASAVLSSLDVIQLAKLFRGCRPYFPDHVRLAKLITEME